MDPIHSLAKADVVKYCPFIAPWIDSQSKIGDIHEQYKNALISTKTTWNVPAALLMTVGFSFMFAIHPDVLAKTPHGFPYEEVFRLVLHCLYVGCMALSALCALKVINDHNSEIFTYVNMPAHMLPDYFHFTNTKWKPAVKAAMDAPLPERLHSDQEDVMEWAENTASGREHWESFMSELRAGSWFTLKRLGVPSGAPAMFRHSILMLNIGLIIGMYLQFGVVQALAVCVPCLAFVTDAQAKHASFVPPWIAFNEYRRFAAAIHKVPVKNIEREERARGRGDEKV